MPKRQMYIEDGTGPVIAYHRAEVQQFPITANLFVNTLGLGFVAVIAFWFAFSPVYDYLAPVLLGALTLN
jgi:hypothetical protein